MLLSNLQLLRTLFFVLVYKDFTVKQTSNRSAQWRTVIVNGISSEFALNNKLQNPLNLHYMRKVIVDERWQRANVATFCEKLVVNLWWSNYLKSLSFSNGSLNSFWCLRKSKYETLFVIYNMWKVCEKAYEWCLKTW